MLNRILWGPYSAARPLVAYIDGLLAFHSPFTVQTSLTLVTAPLVALYQTNPGRGRLAPVEEMLITDPPWPCSMRRGVRAFVAR